MLAIQTFRENQDETGIIEELVKNYADLNFREEKTGFTPIMMASHLNTEGDAIRIVKLLCAHKYYEDQPRIVDIDARDAVQNTCLHHAAISNKLNLCKYLIEMEKADLTLKNLEGELAIDLTTADEVENYLSQH
jgi:serine/threonine protein kinase